MITIGNELAGNQCKESEDVHEQVLLLLAVDRKHVIMSIPESSKAHTCVTARYAALSRWTQHEGGRGVAAIPQ